MNAAEKAEFVTTLCQSIRDQVIGDIPKMPEEWDGHELRELLADLFVREKTFSMRGRRRGSRGAKYDVERYQRNIG